MSKLEKALKVLEEKRFWEGLKGSGRFFFENGLFTMVRNKSN